MQVTPPAVVEWPNTDECLEIPFENESEQLVPLMYLDEVDRVIVPENVQLSISTDPTRPEWHKDITLSNRLALAAVLAPDEVGMLHHRFEQDSDTLVISSQRSYCTTVAPPLSDNQTPPHVFLSDSGEICIPPT